eukprot:11285869-Alexandrium_andersonii.AAC.1
MGPNGCTVAGPSAKTELGHSTVLDCMIMNSRTCWCARSLAAGVRCSFCGFVRPLAGPERLAQSVSSARWSGAGGS